MRGDSPNWSSETTVNGSTVGGVGPNSKWDWSLVDASGTVVKKGSALGEEARAIATAKKARDKLKG